MTEHHEDRLRAVPVQTLQIAVACHGNPKAQAMACDPSARPSHRRCSEIRTLQRARAGK